MGDGFEQPSVDIYVWILWIPLAAFALVLLLYCGTIVVWMLVLRRMAKSGIRSWDELEAKDDLSLS